MSCFEIISRSNLDIELKRILSMTPLEDLRDLMLEQMRDLYHAEAFILNELYDLPAKVYDDELRAVVKRYIDAHDEQIMRLRQVFDLQFEQKRGGICEPMFAMVSQIDKLIRRSMDPEIRDAAIITALQHIMHYKIAGYGAATTYAKLLGYFEEARILHLNLKDEKDFDRKLAMMADSMINPRAIEPSL